MYISLISVPNYVDSPMPVCIYVSNFLRYRSVHVLFFPRSCYLSKPMILDNFSILLPYNFVIWQDILTKFGINYYRKLLYSSLQLQLLIPITLALGVYMYKQKDIYLYTYIHIYLYIIKVLTIQYNHTYQYWYLCKYLLLFSKYCLCEKKLGWVTIFC